MAQIRHDSAFEIHDSVFFSEFISFPWFNFLRAIFRENRKSYDTREKNEFFSSRQNIPFSNLIEEK